jgi:hypothetical protein
MGRSRKSIFNFGTDLFADMRSIAIHEATKQGTGPLIAAKRSVARRVYIEKEKHRRERLDCW